MNAPRGPAVSAPRSEALEQARALLWLRWKLWQRRLLGSMAVGRILLGSFSLLMGVLMSAMMSGLTLLAAHELGRDPATLAAQGGPLAVFAIWVSIVLIGRLWFALIPATQGASFLDPRRFRLFPVSARLLGALNLGALFFDPVWLVLYPPLACIAWGVSRFAGAPAFWALLVSEWFAVWAAVGVLHAAAALGAAFDARPVLRRGLSIFLILAGFAAFQLSVARPGRPGLATVFAAHRTDLIAWTPAGWCGVLAQALSDHSLLHALTPALLLFLSGLVANVVAHRVSRRDWLRPSETVQAPATSRSSAGWQLPLLPPVFSALLEKEAKTVVRVGWLQLVLVPVGYLFLMQARFSGPQPLLIAAVYAHLGVLEIATNAFGRDLSAVRALFLWPISRRQALLAKNLVAYGFSLAIFLLLAMVSRFTGRATPSQFLVALLAHAAIFPLFATLGIVVSVLFAAPMRGARLRGVRGGGALGARLAAMGLLAGLAWAPYAVGLARSLDFIALYAGELLVMVVVYGGLLGFGAQLIEDRREPLLAALAKED